jgi:hypothetical protein
MGRAVGLLAVSVLLLIGSVPSHAGGPTPLLTTRAVERFPTADIGYLAWSQLVRRKQHVFVKPDGQARFRVNEWANGATGGIDGTQLIYQEFARRRSELRLMDLTTRVRSVPPAGINTRQWEYWPDLDEGRILFGRFFPAQRGKRQVILYDPGASPQFQVLAQTVGFNKFLDPGQVDGDYAVWTRWRNRRDRTVDCEVYVRDLAADTTTVLPNPGNRCQFGASVSEDGTVFFGRAGYACGRGVRLMMDPQVGPTETLVSFPRGRDFYFTDVYREGSTDHILYDPLSCRRARQDIFEVTIP